MTIFQILLSITMALAFLPVRGQEADHLYMDLNFVRDSLRVKATYTLLMESEADSLFFILNPGYALQAVQAEGLRTHEMGQRPDRPFPGYVLKFEEPYQAGASVDVNFEYAIDLRETNHLNSDWIELNVDKLWFPIRGDIGNKLTYELRIADFPPDYDLVGHMDATLTREGDQIHIVQDTPVEEALVLAGKDMRLIRTTESIDFFASRHTPDSVLSSMSLKTREIIEYLNGLFGDVKRIGDFRVVLRNAPKSELGYQFNRKNMIVTGVEFDDYGNLAHEIAHFWWTGADFINEPWMNESFANYLMFLTLEQFDPDKYTLFLERYREMAADAPAVGTATLFSEGAYPAYYHKGFVLLKYLETQIGKPRMTEILNECLARDLHSTNGFLDVLEKSTSLETRSQFQTALRQ